MMSKRIKVVAALMIFALLISGCADLRDKFIRKPKKEETAMKYQMVREYDVHPNLELYTKRYIFWKTWHKELLTRIMEDNRKKMTVAAEQEVSNLNDMRRMLVDEKGDELQKIIDQMAEIENTLKTTRITRGNRVKIRRKLESLGREVRRNYSYTKIKGSLRDEFRTD
ncbi:MAG: hypothetical protein PVH45_05710 [Candidatus Omnitrophota bacterium]|jgi:hypothetical protein